jgi:ribonuclease HI
MTTPILPKVEAWTDGACKGNPGPGGYGVYLRHTASGKARQLAGAMPGATNNIMELLAVIRALKALKTPTDVTIHTDSKYIVLFWHIETRG